MTTATKGTPLAPTRPVSRTESRLLEALQRRDRSTERPRNYFHLERDRKWLEKEVGTQDLRQLASRMARRGSLFRLGDGLYVTAPSGSTVPAQAASFELALDATLRRRTTYYLGFLSALIAHGLTDVSERTAYVAVDGNRISGEDLQIGGRPVHLVRIYSEKKWGGIEQVSLRGRSSYRRSDLEKTLLDCLDRPELCGGAEIWIRAWERALREARVNLDQLKSHALEVGGVIALRCAFWLYELDEARASDELLAQLRPRPRSGRFKLDSSDEFGAGEWSRDRRTGLLVNVPMDLARGWISYAK